MVADPNAVKVRRSPRDRKAERSVGASKSPNRRERRSDGATSGGNG